MVTEQKNIKSKSFWCFDFETVQKGDTVSVTIATWKHSNYPAVFVKSELDSNDIIKDMLDHIISFKDNRREYRVNNGGKTKILYAHNGANFDNTFIIAWLLKNNFSQVLNNDQLVENTFFLLAGDLNKNLRLEFNYKGFIFMLKDSIRFLQLSIAKLGSMLNSNKLEAKEFYGKSILDLSKKDQQLYLEYAQKDTQILCQSIKQYAEWYPAIHSKWTYTQATISYNSWFRDSSFEYQNYVFLQEHNEFSRRHYCGGFTTVNELYLNKVVENIYYYDINSSYPAIMLDKVAVLQVNKNYYEKVVQKYPETVTYMVTVFIKKATIKKDCIPILRLITTKKDSELGYVRNVIFAKEYSSNCFFMKFWQEEWEYILKWYDIEFEEIKRTYFFKENIFNDYITHFRNIKETASTALNEATLNDSEKVFFMFQKQIAKLFSNSLYGKFGARGFYNNHYYIKGKHNFEKNQIIEINGEKCAIVNKKKDQFEGWECYNILRVPERVEWVKSKKMNVYISSYITMKGRIALYKMIEKIGYHNFVYCDTDSIISKVEFPKEVIHNSEYGKWKLEGFFKYFKALRSKCYICSDSYNLGEDSNQKFVISGIKDPLFIKRKNLTIEQFNDTLETTQTVFVNMKGGKGTVERIKKVIKN